MECARAYTQAGATVAVADINLARNSRGMRLPRHLAGTGWRLPVMSPLPPPCRRPLRQPFARYGRLDVIRNNAGISSPSKPLHETTNEQWARLRHQPEERIYYTTLHGIEALKASRGSILNTAGMVGLLARRIGVAYVATKGAVIALTKAMALDYAPFGIRVNAFCPAAVWTPLLREVGAEQPNPAGTEDFLNHIRARLLPESRWWPMSPFSLSDRAFHDRCRAADQRRRRTGLSSFGYGIGGSNEICCH